MPGASGNKRTWKGRPVIECRVAPLINSKSPSLYLQSADCGKQGGSREHKLSRPR
jgi:hypothetical protein